MAYCTECGTRLEPGHRFCAGCGTPADGTVRAPVQTKSDPGNFGGIAKLVGLLAVVIVGFFVLVGLVLPFVFGFFSGLLGG